MPSKEPDDTGRRFCGTLSARAGVRSQEFPMNKAIGLVGFGLSGILTLAAVLPAGAAPVMTSTAQVGTVATDQVTQVRWRGGAAVAAGVGAGIALGALAASQPHYYGYGGYYDYEP